MSALHKDTLEQLSAKPAEQEAQQSANSKAKSTLGKWGHWALTYLGGDWLLNSAVGVGFTYITARTAFGKKYYVEPTGKAIRAVLAPLFKQEESLEKAVGGFRDFLSIMFGGTVINPVLTRLESHENKKAISKSIDTAIYGKERVENDPQFKEAYDAIDKEPVKDTKSVWISRGIALLPLYIAATNPKSYAFLKHNDVPVLKYLSFDRISNFTRTTAEKIGIRPQKMIHTTMKNPTTGKVTSNWQALHDYLGFDYGLTVYYAILHAISFSAVARMFQTSRDNKTCRKTIGQSGQDVSETGESSELPAAQELVPETSGHSTKAAYDSQPKQAEHPAAKIHMLENHGVLAAREQNQIVTA